MSISAGPSFYHYWYDPKPNQGRVLQEPAEVGLDSLSVHSRKSYAGGKAAFTINTLNNELLPTRGVSWITEFTALQSLNESAKSLTRLNSTLDVYAVLDQPNRLLAALHFGGGHIFSDHFEYFQALSLGGNNYLRGYRVNRFSGASMAYASAELKLKLFDFKTHLIKGDLGLVGFNDIGRVWLPAEYSKKWHHGYGGGIYLIPFNAVMVSALVAMSEEETLFNLSIGTRLNMVFQGQ
jgi:outer membrane protein assembly factor BamA